MRNTLKKLSLALVISFGFLSFATNSAQANSFLPETGVAASVPTGYIAFCMRQPADCATQSGSDSVTLDKATWKLLNDVNENVNDDIWPMDDHRHYGRAEYWTIPADGYGDCDDYALTKRHQLIAKGIPEAALKIAVVFTARGEKHAVLTVTTDRGDYVLDNQISEILPWNETSLSWVARQSTKVSSGWVSLNVRG